MTLNHTVSERKYFMLIASEKMLLRYNNANLLIGTEIKYCHVYHGWELVSD
jgi:hypothetical protein